MLKYILIGTGAILAIAIAAFAVLYSMGAYPEGEPKYKITDNGRDRFLVRYLHPEDDWFSEVEPVMSSPYSLYSFHGDRNGIWKHIFDYYAQRDKIEAGYKAATSARKRAQFRDALDQLDADFMPRAKARKGHHDNFFQGVKFYYQTQTSIFREPLKLRGDYQSNGVFATKFRSRFVAALPIFTRECGYDGAVEKDTYDYRELCNFDDRGMDLNWLRILPNENTVFAQSHRGTQKWTDGKIYPNDILYMDGYFGCELGQIEFYECSFFPTRVEVVPR